VQEGRVKTTELACLEANLTSIFDRRTNLATGETWVVIGEDQLLPDGDWVEDYLFTEHETADTLHRTDSIAQLRDALHSIDGAVDPLVLSSARGPLISGPSPDAGRPDSPGALRRKPDKENIVPPPDCYAFYLPWHYFTARTWGIYLLVEGIEEFGARVEATAHGGLTRSQSRKVAKSFLFHHEAYHNAVETFAVRLEVSHRVPCYKGGFEALYRKGLAYYPVHEEGLATAYAIEKVRLHLFSEIPDKAVKALKRKIADAALRELVRAMPREYASALNVLPPSGKFNESEQLFQESAHTLSLPHVPRVKPGVWGSALHSMGPSLQRNRSFSYVIQRSHPALRGALSVRYLSVKRKHFLHRLKETVGGEQVGGGKHPKWLASNGRKVSVPSGTDLNPYTCAQILKQFGLSQGIAEFMQG
jgi:hypothetical protein